jgi:hypothetical protein
LHYFRVASTVGDLGEISASNRLIISQMLLDA